MFEKPFSFIGRIGRKEYAISFVIFVSITLISSTLSTISGKFWPILSIILLLPALYFFIAQACKRSHDIGNSGWYQLIPFYNLYLLFADGENGENGYGTDPRIPKGTKYDQMEN